jgi:valacyclovir hydrolase
MGSGNRHSNSLLLERFSSSDGVQAMANFEYGQSRVYYEESGAGTPVLLLPGWAGSIEELTPLRDALTSRFRVIAADLPGSGKSGPQPRTYTPTYLEDDARTFLAMLDALQATPAHVVGFSDGGEYALLMAALKPDAVRSIATWGSAGSLGDNRQMAGAMANMVDDPIPPMREFSGYLKSVYGEDNARTMTQSLANALLAIMDAGSDISRSKAANIACPALLITGENDFLATPALVADMAGAIDQGQFIEAKGASHPVHHEQPQWLVGTITAWLDKTD